MLIQTTVNLYPIVKTVGILLIVFVIIFLLHNLGGLKIFSKHNNELTKNFLEKFPLVSPLFFSRNWKEQTAENNQEIHENNLKLKQHDRDIKEIRTLIAELNKSLQGQLDYIIKELERRG